MEKDNTRVNRRLLSKKSLVESSEGKPYANYVLKRHKLLTLTYCLQMFSTAKTLLGEMYNISSSIYFVQYTTNDNPNPCIPP